MVTTRRSTELSLGIKRRPADVHGKAVDGPWVRRVSRTLTAVASTAGEDEVLGRAIAASVLGHEVIELVS
jgi:hypothetical protein